MLKTIHPEVVPLGVMCAIVIALLLLYWGNKWITERREQKRMRAKQDAKIVQMDLDAHEQGLGGY